MNENLYASNVSLLSGTQLGSKAAIWLNGCNAGSDAPGGSPIAQLVSNQLQRGVYAYDAGMYFSATTAANDSIFAGEGKNAPTDLPSIWFQTENNITSRPMSLSHRIDCEDEELRTEVHSCSVGLSSPGRFSVSRHQKRTLEGGARYAFVSPE